MTQLKAFVGHSFAPDDHSVVDAFIKYFTQLRAMDIGFTWESAEPAEPKDLADKVMNLIKDKNVFIGICTRKEAAIEPLHLAKSKFRKGVLNGPEERFSWKTSDWVIQEIGLAIGRGMDLILLIERGLRPPGGLQGNLEYIQFDRSAPEKSFGKLLEMIQALRPKVKPASMPETETRVASEEKATVEDKQDAWWLEPKPDWNKDRYESALFRVILKENSEGERKIKEAFFASAEGQAADNQQRWEALAEHLRIRFGTGGKLGALEELAKNNPDNGDVHRYLGLGYEEYEEYDKAAQCFLESAGKTDDRRKQLGRHGEATIALMRAGRPDSARKAIKNMKALVLKVPDGELVLLETFRKMADFYKDKDLLFGVLERILQFHPDDFEARFSLALNYSEAAQNELSLLHYLKISYQNRGSGTWNNLGVQFELCNLSSKCVDAYRKAEEGGETLAMSNLAQKFISSGFLREADEVCKRAMKIEDFHQNVSHAVSRIKAIPDEESKKELELVDKARPISEFYRDYGRAVVQEDISEHVGRWDGPDCELEVTIRENVFSATGNYEVPRSGLRLHEALLGLSAPPPTMVQYRVRYTGKITGHAGHIEIIKEEISKPSFTSTILTGTDNRKKAIIVVSETLKEIRIAEKDSSNKLTFHTLTRLN